MYTSDAHNQASLLSSHPTSIPQQPTDSAKQSSKSALIDEIANEAKREILRQSRWSFNLYFATITASTTIGVVGGGLLLSGLVTEGSLTAATGFVSSACCTQMGKDSQEKLEKLLERLENISS